MVNNYTPCEKTLFKTSPKIAWNMINNNFLINTPLDEIVRVVNPNEVIDNLLKFTPEHTQYKNAQFHLAIFSLTNGDHASAIDHFFNAQCIKEANRLINQQLRIPMNKDGVYCTTIGGLVSELKKHNCKFDL